VSSASRSLSRKLNALKGTGAPTEAGVDDAIAEAITEIKAWRAAAIDACRA
jgi:hypothetical protein